MSTAVEQPVYPLVIDNGAGERLTFERRVAEPDGERVEGEARVAPGAGPPMHVHYRQAEALTVVQGRIGFQRPGGEPQFAGPGETVVFEAGDAHRFWNAGSEELVCRAWIKPAGNAEFFLGALFASQRERGGGRPGLWDIAFLAQRYRSEYAVLEIPLLLQRIAFPLVVGVGRVLGRYRKYAGAPPPLA